MSAGRAAVARTVNRFDRHAEAGTSGESRIGKLSGKVEELRPVKLNAVGQGKISFRMAARIKQWQARSRRRPVPKGKVFVEKLVHVVTSHAPGYGPQTGPKAEIDPLQQRWMELNDPDYANQVKETRKRVRQIREDREFLETCYDLLDTDQDGKLTPEELEHWIALLLADHASALDDPRCALKYWVRRNERAALTDAERLDLQARLDKGSIPRDILQYDWQDFLLVTLDFYTLAGTLAMHKTFCALLAPVGDQESSSSKPNVTYAPTVALPRPPLKLPRTPVPVVPAGSWEQHQQGATVRPRPKHRQPRLPLPPVPADVLRPSRPRQPRQPTRPVPAFGPGTPKRPLRALRTPAPSSQQGQLQQAPTAAKDRTNDVQLTGAQAFMAVPDNLNQRVRKQIDVGVRSDALRAVSAQSARAARRVTHNTWASQAVGWDANATPTERSVQYGWANSLPVVIVPGLCSSGLEVKRSDVSPAWEGERVWFSIEKLGAQRSATTRAAAQVVKVAAAPAKLMRRAISKATTHTVDAIGEYLLRFHLHRARKLMPGDADGSSDPVVRVELLNVQGEVIDYTESTIKHKTRNPYWNETYDLGLHVRLNDVHSVRLKVLDDDGVLASRDILGEITIELQRQVWVDGYQPVPREWRSLEDTRDLVGSSAKQLATTLHKIATLVTGTDILPAAGLPFAGEIECWADVVALDRDVETSSLVSSESDCDIDDGRASPVIHVDVAEGFDTKMWLRHMSLAPDAHSDPHGIEVRAVPGLSGVDYLQPGHVMGATTWVFGPVIQFLLGSGYDESKMKGAPYDWRMPPMYLEKRDGYFSKLCETIEETHRDNGGKPVVLLAHSMGNNMAHYFCNWVLKNGDKLRQVEGATQSNGEAWLDKYVYSLFGIAGPYLGASETLRACICGDDFGIGPALLPAHHARSLCQGMGSAAWLLPRGRLVEQPVAYDRVERKTETSVKLANSVSGHYEPRNVDEALRMHAAKHIAEQKTKWYDLDPCMSSGSAMMAPPLKRVFHVYGINLKTQRGFAFAGGKDAHHLDNSVNYGQVEGMRYHKGIISETRDTSQSTLPPDTFTENAEISPEATHLRRVSGDGTVPYTSLQHTLSWNSSCCQSQVVELDEAEHREILNDKRFHEVLGGYLNQTLVVYVMAARNLAAKDLIKQSSDPFCIITLHTSPWDVKRTTKTHKRTLNPEFNEIFTFGTGMSGIDVLKSARVISVEVRDSDFGGLTSDHIGTMALPLKTITDSPTHAVNGWFKLVPDGHANDPDLVSKGSIVCNGEIFVHFELESPGQSYRGVPDHLDIVHENMRSYDTDPDGVHQHHKHHKHHHRYHHHHH